MTNDLISSPETPVQHLEIPPSEADATLWDRLRAASTSRVVFVRQRNGQGSLQARSDADSSHARAALACIAGALVSGPASRVAAELSKVTIATRRPRQIATDEDETLYRATMTEALMDYPLDVVIWALAKQRAANEFWPAEAEVRRLCEKAVAERLAMRNEAERLVREMEAAERQQAAQPRRYDGPAAEFMARARARCTKGQVLSYFSKWGMRIEGDIVWVKAPIGETMVKRIAGDIADELGFEIKRCRKIPTSFPEYDGPDATPEEKAEFVRQLRALADSIRLTVPHKKTEDDLTASKRRLQQHISRDAEGNGSQAADFT